MCEQSFIRSTRYKLTSIQFCFNVLNWITEQNMVMLTVSDKQSNALQFRCKKNTIKLHPWNILNDMTVAFYILRLFCLFII